MGNTSATLCMNVIQFSISIQSKNSILLPIYSFGRTYIHFVFKYSTIHTYYITTKLHPTFPGAPLTVNGASWNIQGNPTGTIRDICTGMKGLVHYTHNSHACTTEFSCINSLRPGDTYVHWWAGSPLVKAMTCCLLAPSHHLYQGRPFSSISIAKFQFWYE